MAKQPPLPDRFRITCETSEAEMGVLIAQLTRMGFTNIAFELITDVPAYKRNASAEHAQGAQEFALAWIAEHPTFNIRDLAKAFKAAGRNTGAGYYAINRLVEKGTIVELGERNYQRADVKAIEPPKDEAEPARASAPQKKFDTRAEDEILKFARKHGGKFNTSRLVKLFVEQGRARNSVYASINSLMNDKVLKRVGEPGSGDYALLAKGKEAKPKKAKPKPEPKAAPVPHLNGASHQPETAEVVTHG